MRKLFASVVVSGVVALAAIPSAHADTHGCISVAGVVNVTSGSGGPVTQSNKCDFGFVAGDTYSGIGDFKIACVLELATQTYSHAATDVPANQVPLSCNDGATVTLTLQPGASVAAGNTM